MSTSTDTASPAATSVVAAHQVLSPGSVTKRSIAAYLRAVPPVDEVGIAERTAELATRSVKREAKHRALLLAVA
ncbi:MAG: hypothetical protein OER95_09745, partial [Acidimicrobiia bacterium]|nr:hypothetical protein [Acidimicrobiia bacterium]